MSCQFVIRSALFGFYLSASLCLTAAAQTTAPSTPKSALKNLYAATEKADAAAMQKIMLIENDPQGEALQAYGEFIVAAKRLDDIAKQKYGSVPTAFAQPTILPEDAAKIDAAEMTIDGDSATIKIAGKPDPIKLRKVNGDWRVLIPQGADDADHRAKRLTWLHSFTEALNQTSDDIAGDKFPTIQEAETRIKERVGAVLLRAMQTDAPTSGPATQAK